MGPGSTQLLVACRTEYAATSNKKLSGGGLLNVYGHGQINVYSVMVDSRQSIDL